MKFNPESNRCIICNSNTLNSYKAYASDSQTESLVNIKECGSCTFAWQHPRGRTQAESVQFFEEAYNDKGKDKSTPYFDPLRKILIANLEFSFIKTLPGNNSSILDIGAGGGFFAQVAAENGWTVTAVDPALELSQITGNSNITPIKGTTEMIPKGQLHDVVTLWDIIEHTSDPLVMLKDAKKYIKNGGWLVLETGNFKSAQRVSAGLNHWIYQLDHRWYFSPESITILLDELGFTDIKFSNVVLRPDWNGDANYPGPSRLELLKFILEDPLHLIKHLAQYFRLKQSTKWKMSGIEIFSVAAKKS